MKKILIFLVFSVLFISGCGVENIQFSGESDTWEGNYRASIDGSTENGEFIFNHKQAEEDMVIENLTISINDGETVRNQSEYKGATINIPTGCSGCAVTNPDNPIEVIIEWGDKKETFSMEPK